MDKRMLNNNAVQKLLTLNPETKLSANRIILALMTNKKSPKVTMVIGNVNIMKTGLTMAFKRPKTAATIIAVVKLATLTPGKKYAKTRTAMAESKILKTKFIIKFLIC